jgi:hypothetical protein
MAFTVTVRRLKGRKWRVNISETAGTTTSETAMVDTTTGLKPPGSGVIARHKGTYTSGGAANRTSQVRAAAGVTGVTVPYESDPTAVATVIDDGGLGGVYQSDDPAGKLYYTFGWGANTNNVGSAEIYIEEV